MTFLPCRLLAALMLLAGLALAPGSVSAAQSYDSCTGFIDSLPATIATQGVWCLRQHLGTSISSGSAITIAANNVTIDCNDFKIGGLAAGDGSTANGIHADGKQNAVVRQCNVRGFYQGIFLDGGAGHLVEDNRLDNNLHRGIVATGANILVQHNRVYDTGGSTGQNLSIGIYADAHVIENTVAGVFADTENTFPRGIVLASASSVARDNRVRGLEESGSGNAIGIRSAATGTSVDGNQVVAAPGTNGNGIEGAGITDTVCSNNVIVGFSTEISQCLDNGGNASL